MAYTTTTNIPLKMPTPGTREPANIALINDNMLQLDGHDHLTGKGVAVSRLRSGLQANRPAAGLAGAVYFATDTGQYYVDTGTAWVQFITSGGTSTVTGWTLIDPVIRDTAYFGPEPTGTADATIARTGAGALRVDTHLGVGVNPAAWGSAYRAAQVGASAALWGDTGGQGFYLTSNTYFDGTNRRAVVAGIGFEVAAEGTNLKLKTLPSVAAGAVQTTTDRMALSQQGTLTLTPDAGQAALVWAAGKGFLIQNVSTGNPQLLTQGGANLTFLPSGGYIHPDGDNLIYNGAPSQRWVAVYAVNGTIQTSSLDMKENIRPLDPVAALAAVKGTQVILFNYKQPESPPGVEGTEPLPPPPAFEHAGYDAATTDPLLVMDDESVNPQNTATVVLAALQALLARVEALEARNA